MTFKRIASGLTASFFLLSPLTALAQSASTSSAPSHTVDCFQYYTFGSVQADLTSNVASVVSGTPITFAGTLKNSNPYPIVDGALYVKLFKSRPTMTDGNGPDVVDQFLVKGSIAIPANGSIPVSFSWKVPSYAQSGDYRLATFFTTARKFNLLGLSFSDDIVGNTVPFTVSGEETTGVQFDKADVTVNGAPYLFAASPPQLSATGTVTVSATIKNTGAAASATIQWKVYQWDAQLRENVVQEEAPMQVTVPANGSIKVPISVTDTRYPVYLAVGELQWKDTKSVIGVRFVREGVDRTRINFPSVTTFPLKAGTPTTLFSCLHNAGTSDVVSNGELDLTLSDVNGKVIRSYTYKGDVTGAMMGIAETFTPTQDYDNFTLDARLYHDGHFVDEAHLVYDCAQIDPRLCSPPPEPSAVASLTDMLGSGVTIALIIAVVILLPLLLWLRHRMRKNAVSATTYTK